MKNCFQKVQFSVVFSELVLMARAMYGSQNLNVKDVCIFGLIAVAVGAVMWTWPCLQLSPTLYGFLRVFSHSHSTCEC